MDPSPATADELMTLVAGLRRVVRRRLRTDLPGPRLPGAQVELLQIVEAAPKIGVAAAARTLHLAGNTVSTLVNQLVDAGMLRRDRSRRPACGVPAAHRRRRRPARALEGGPHPAGGRRAGTAAGA